MIGDDVVDLRDPETRAGAVHPRFDERVMAPAERRWLEGRAEPERDRWLPWAAKEAAYKAARRLDPTLVFSPSRFVTSPFGERSTAMPPREGAAHAGTVTIGGKIFDVVVRVVDDAIHAVASAAGAVHHVKVVAECIRAASTDASAAARRLAIDVVAARSSLRPLGVEMCGRVPELRTGDAVSLALSLSHHGAVVGFAVAFPEGAS